MLVCELCGTALDQDRCAVCTAEERARFNALGAGSFPGNALPPAGLTQGTGVVALRRALANGDLDLAEELWAGLLRTIQPLGAVGRRQLADSFEAFAALKDALGKREEAGLYRRRAQSASKDPALVKRREAGTRAAVGQKILGLRTGVSSRSPRSEGPSPETLRTVREQLALNEVKERRHKIMLTLGASGLVGLWVAVVTGLPMAFMVAVSCGTGWLWIRRA